MNAHGLLGSSSRPDVDRSRGQRRREAGRGRRNGRVAETGEDEAAAVLAGVRVWRRWPRRREEWRRRRSSMVATGGGRRPLRGMLGF